MTDHRYYQAALQVPASETPGNLTVAHRVFEIRRHSGMVAIYLGLVEGGDGEGSTVLLATGTALKVISVLEVIVAQLGR